ncbi:aldo/keto reductase [Companilactobacillus keshanensis]|uniref:Aldo/keto reductase n=1 Tax=Companilactobacillus keshanensis TaxID=2486003 RepID=A0ABW4BRT3_9LACO|nr:aldo/keto reductase [Companilactobacillus keshanensis]
MSILTEYYTLSNGVKIPKVGFGTWQIPDGKIAYDSVTSALDNGYRHIDTALAYGNEESVGKAIRDSGISRKDIFITSKLPGQTKTYKGTMDDFNTTMKNLDIDYLDLYIIHAPWPWTEIGKNCDKENRDIWKAMEEIYASKRVRAIGVSNFTVHDLENIKKVAKVQPMIDQIQYYVGFTEPKISTFAKENNILIEAYSPLATGGLIHNEQINQIAEKYQVSVPQLALRFVIQNGALPLPKATHVEHIIDNAKLDFEISTDDMKKLNEFPDTSDADHHNPTQG